MQNDGFIYIYTNNESYYNVNFDNLRIAHKLAKVMEVNNYYPYGLLNSSMSFSRSGNKLKYQTKESESYLDYNVLDFGARHYDAATGRWTVPDPMMQYASPYIAMGGNPVSMIDPDGMQSRSLYSSEASMQQATASIAQIDAMSTGSRGGGYNWLAHSARDNAAMQLQYGSTYEQQASERVETLMSLDGYTAHDGTVYSYDNSGNIGHYDGAVMVGDINLRPSSNNSGGFVSDGGVATEIDVFVVDAKNSSSSDHSDFGTAFSTALFGVEAGLYNMDVYASYGLQRNAGIRAGYLKSIGRAWNTGLLKNSDKFLEGLEIGGKVLGKLTFWAGVATTGYNMVQNPTMENIKWGSADIIVGAIGLNATVIAGQIAAMGLAVPGLNVAIAGGALIYAGYRVYSSYGNDK